MKFSERIGINAPKIEIQTDYIDEDLINSLWNLFDIFYATPLKQQDSSYYRSTKFKKFIEDVWFSFFKEPIDTIPRQSYDVVKELRDRFYNFYWYQVYDFIEFIAKNSGSINEIDFTNSCNFILKRELSAYRFIENELSPITDENQIEQIQKAIDDSATSKLRSVNIHLQASLGKLSDKMNPDYRNSIKESISAVESLVQIISGDKKAELGKALKVIKDKIGLHGALEQGFSKLYGYTSDSDGIRHSLSEESTLDLEDAIYMLTTCSAFINYLIIKSDKAGIKLK